MVALDFSGLHERRCKGYDTPDTEGSDYELWFPHADGRHRAPENSFLGRQFQYTRRKQHSECFNGEDFEGVIIAKSCPCTEADYECDVGWEMDKNEFCVKKFHAYGDDQKKRDCEVFGEWYESQGYRLIPGDRCVAGLQVAPKRRGCGVVSSVSNALFAPFKATESKAAAPEAPAPSSGGLGEPTTGSEDSGASNTKNLVWAAIVLAVLYYGWPIIEAIILILPIPNAPGVVDQIKAVGNTAQEVVGSVMKSDTKRRNMGGNSDYQQNLEDAPNSFMGNDDDDDDNSDDDIGKAAGGSSSGLNYDSDEKFDEESGAQNELIDLGGGSSGAARSAANIKPLKGPGGM